MFLFVCFCVVLLCVCGASVGSVRRASVRTVSNNSRAGALPVQH